MSKPFKLIPHKEYMKDYRNRMNTKGKSFFDLSTKEKKRIVETAARESNRAQKELMNTKGKTETWEEVEKFIKFWQPTKQEERWIRNFAEAVYQQGRADGVEEEQKRIKVYCKLRIGQCGVPITQSCEYCSALYDVINYIEQKIEVSLHPSTRDRKI